MRLLKLGIYHSTYLRDFYLKRPALREKSYEIQHQALIEDCYGSSDFWTNELEKLGYETNDIIANCESSQFNWANQNNLKFDENNWLFEIAWAQIKKFRPDVLLIADYSTFTREFIRQIRRECSSIKLVLGWCGAPYNDLSVIRQWDIALTCVPELAADFQNQGVRSFHVNHAFAPRILKKIDAPTEPPTDFAFIGSILTANRFHLERERLLIHLVEKTNLQIWSDIKKHSNKERGNFYAREKAFAFVKTARNAGVSEKLLNNLPLVKKVAAWESAPVFERAVDRRIARRTRPPIFGLAMFQQICDSKVIFNNHLDISTESASNMRLFETTGIGTCLLTDWKKNLGALFEPDAEVLTYRTAEECREKVEYILEHPSERKKIAAAGQKRTLREHTFENRAAQIDEIIRAFFAAASQSP